MFVFFAAAAAFLGITAGLTAGKLLSKAGEKISTLGGILPPGSLDPLPDIADSVDPAKKKLPFAKIISVAVLGAIGIIIVKWVGKKFHIKILK